jgi:response regulator RpfG family c-di-GMP phosphodiesterase
MSDYRMPTMNGVEMLSRMMESQPNAPRVIISGYADRSAIIAAVNDVHLIRFIENRGTTRNCARPSSTS